MKYEIVGEHCNQVLAISLDEGESFRAQTGAMMAKDATIHITGIVEGGPLKALKRSLLGGGRFFLQELSAKTGPGTVLIAPSTPGEIALLPIEKEGQYLRAGAFLAAFGKLDLDVKLVRNAKGLLTGEGLFVMGASGSGAIAVAGFGGVLQTAVAAGRDYLVDFGHLLAWQSATPYSIEKSSQSWFSSITSGEGMLCRFSGPAELWLQMRNPHDFSQWLKHTLSPG